MAFMAIPLTFKPGLMSDLALLDKSTNDKLLFILLTLFLCQVPNSNMDSTWIASGGTGLHQRRHLHPSHPDSMLHFKGSFNH